MTYYAWDGSDGGLGPGIDAAIAAGFQLRAARGQPTCACALAAEIPARHRGRHLSGVLLQAITGTVQQWESWTQMRFPETGDYVFAAGLATVHIEHERDLREYWEPNIWIVHTANPAT